MAEKQTYWVGNLAGDKALITGADERDHWSLHGWTPTDEPGDDFRGNVWLRDPESGAAAPIAWGAREYWLGRGRVPSPPDEPVNPTKDPALTAPEKPPVASAPVDKPTTPAPAAAKTKE